MDRLLEQRRLPFLFVGVAIAVVGVAIANLPESFVESLEVKYGLDAEQSGWLYRILAVAAVAQAVYGAYFVLSPGRASEATAARTPQPAVMASYVRTAVALVGLTLVYGIAALALTGHRGGFWLFATLATAQHLWYYRALRDVADAVVHGAHPSPAIDKPRPWVGAAPDDAPPLVRGVRGISSPAEPPRE